ncbi:MAG: metallophosphoesterase, partial [Sphingopyxis sp.]|nr:metallophosphoesterase [Sphingopyxis sp.]
RPLVEAGTRGRAPTRGGERALTELAKRGVAAVLTGHVHDAFDLVKETAAGPIRMIGAGTLSQRIRSTPPSFNELTIDGSRIDVRVRNLEHVPTPDMQIDDVPPDALPPRAPDEPVAPVGAVPAVHPPVH